MPTSHSIRAMLAALALPLAAAAQQPPVPPALQEAGATSFTIFLGGAPIGTEQIAVNRLAAGWTIASTGRLGAPIDIVARRLLVRYTPEWRAVELTLDATVRGQAQTIRTVVEGTTAKSDLVVAGQATGKTDTVDPDALLLLPTGFFSPYEALAAHLRTAAAGSEMPVYLVPQGSIRVSISRPNDEQVNIPSNGFSLVGTLSRPAQAGGTRLPAVVLVGGSGPADRDSVVFGVPVLGQIAGALADAGFIVVRYDKRGIGQSGGRAESASLADYSEDVRATIKVLADRKDVDPKRIAAIGHSEGGLVALMAAAKDKRIGAVGLIATPGITGADIVLAQQRRLLSRMKLTPEEKQAKVDAQKKIHEAVMTGKGLELLPPDVRRSVDNAEFQSLLMSDPAKLVQDVRQPLLVVQGELDTQVEPENADKLEALARKRKNAPPVEVVKVPGINHLLVPATTGEADEYGTLKDKQVSQVVTQAIVTWLKKTLPTR